MSNNDKEPQPKIADSTYSDLPNPPPAYPPLPPYQPQQTGYQPQQQPPQQQPQTIIIQQPSVVYGGPTHYGEYPQTLKCPHCRVDIVTRTQTSVGLLAWIICFVLCFVGCYLCCFIPFCVGGCKDVEHKCPNCNQFLGKYKRL